MKYLSVIACLLAMIPYSQAQQLAEIDGAIKIGNSTSLTFESGTIRWNPDTSDFEGFVDGKWVSLTNHASINQTFGSEKDGVTEYGSSTAYDGTAGNKLGVCVSVDSAHAIVGANGSNSNAGAAYAYYYTDGGWEQEYKFLPSDGATGDEFGWNVDISGNRAIISAHKNTGNGSGSGAAYIFERNEYEEWNQVAKLTPSDGAAGDFFGWAVAIDNDIAVITASSKNSLKGAAYVFEFDGTNWNETAILEASDGQSGHRFGWSCAIQDAHIVIGAITAQSDKGAAYVFNNDGSNWTEQTILTAPNGMAADRFGRSVTISGQYIVVGAYRNDDAGPNMGAVYIYSNQGGTGWNYNSKITINDEPGMEYFGWSVSLDGDYLAIGANRDDTNGVDSGSAYVFQRSGSAWNMVTKLKASEPGTEDNMGWSVSISGNAVVIGAYLKDAVGTDSGIVYFY